MSFFLNFRHSLRHLFFLSTLLWTFQGHGQQWRWAQQMTGQENGFGRIKSDLSGNHYVTGGFTDSARVGNYTLVSLGGLDAFVTKIDSNGQYQWLQTLKGDTNDNLSVAVLDTLGHLYVYGYATANAMLGNTAIAGPTCFIARLSAQTGAVEQVTLTPKFAQVVGKPDGTLYLTGDFYTHTLQFGSIQIANTNVTMPFFSVSDCYVAALSPTGTWLWATAGGGEGYQTAEHIAITRTGDLLVAGYYSGANTGVDSLRFGAWSIPATFGTAQAFLTGISASGTWQWVRDFTSADVVRFNEIALDSLDQIYLTGTLVGFYLQTHGDTLINHLASPYMSFIAKLSPNGHGLWAISTGIENQETALAIADNQHFYVAGYATTDSIDIGGISLDSIRGLTYLGALDSSGRAHWIQRVGLKTSSSATGLATDVAQRLTVCGGFVKSITFPPFQLTTRDSTHYNGFLAQLIPPPFIHRFSPSSGPAGTVVRISGAGFDGATAVLFGSIPATAFTVLPDGSIQVTVPPGVSSLGVPIRVVGVGGTGQSVDVYGRRGPQGIQFEQVGAFELWPNPAYGRLHLMARAGQVLATVTVRDALRRVVRQDAGGKATADLSLAGLPAGLYVVQAGTTTRRLVIE